MSLRIRLSRGGAKKRPYYRIVIADSRSPRDGKFIERVGTYNPMVPQDHPERILLKEDRIKYWMGVGALPSERVAKFLGQADIIPIPSQTKKNQPKAKAQELLKAKAKAAEDAAAKAKEEAEAAAAAAAAPAEEAPAEEAAAEEAPAEETAAS